MSVRCETYFDAITELIAAMRKRGINPGTDDLRGKSKSIYDADIYKNFLRATILSKIERAIDRSYISFYRLLPDNVEYYSKQTAFEDLGEEIIPVPQYSDSLVPYLDQRWRVLNLLRYKFAKNSSKSFYSRTYRYDADMSYTARYAATRLEIARNRLEDYVLKSKSSNDLNSGVQIHQTSYSPDNYIEFSIYSSCFDFSA